MTGFDIRPGEVRLPYDPAGATPDAGLVFIGRVHSPWRSLDDCPKNLRLAREAGGGASIEIAAAFRPGLKDLAEYSHAIVLTWLDRARRDIIVLRPRSASGTHGAFSLRSPIRPNPIGLAVVKIMALDPAAGTIGIDAIDCLDGTPVLDVKPYLPSIDAVFDANGEPLT